LEQAAKEAAEKEPSIQVNSTTKFREMERASAWEGFCGFDMGFIPNKLISALYRNQ
jgi:hypothetical protein